MARGGSRCGAGRPGWHGKAEQFRHIDVRRFQRENMLRGGSWSWQWRDTETQKVVSSIGIIGSTSHITLSYSVGDQSICDRVNISRTACGLGGSRAWFHCPRCSARVAKLYLRQGRFACRGCQRLAYSSQSEDAIGRIWRQQNKVEAKLEHRWQRPKHMHHRTYHRLLSRLFKLEEAREDAFALAVARMGWVL
jgi:hypothetical protein